MNRRELEASTLDFFGTLDQIVTPIMLTDLHYRHLFRNQAFKAQIGYDFDEVHDRKTWFERAFPDPAYRREAKRLWDEQLADIAGDLTRHIKLLVRIHCKNGLYRWYEIHEHEKEDYKVVTFLDVDDIQTKNLELLKTIKFNNLLNASIAHDIRSPIATLKSLVQFNEVIQGSENQLSQLMTRINNQIARIFDILDSSVIHHGDALNHFRFQKQRIALAPFIERVKAYYEEEMAGHHKHMDLALGGHEYVVYDPFILEVMFRNILSNAIKHTAPHSMITIGVEQNTHYTDIWVEDHGGGIAPEAVDLIMQPLSEHRRTERQDLRMGFGIGMILSKEILESHWGKLIIEPNPPIGSIFRIRIPAYIPEFEEAPDNPPERNE